MKTKYTRNTQNIRGSLKLDTSTNEYEQSHYELRQVIQVEFSPNSLHTLFGTHCILSDYIVASLTDLTL